MEPKLTLKAKTVTATISADMLKLLDDYLQSTSSMEAAKVAESMVATATKIIQEEKLNPDGNEQALEGWIWQSWEDIFGVAEQIPHRHPAQDKLVRVIRELTLCPDLGAKVWGQRVMPDLPCAAAVFRERLNGPRTSKNEDQQAKMCEAWVNLNAFAAKLNAAGVWDHENHAIWLLRDALEEDVTGMDAVLRNCHIMTAAVIMEYNGPMTALKLRIDRKLDEAEESMYRGGSLFKGRPGLSPERWAFWIQRFREEGTKSEGGILTDDEVKRAAVRAANLMERWVK